MRKEYGAGELSKILSISVMGVHKRALRHRWIGVEADNERGGGHIKLWLSSSFDAETKAAIARAEGLPTIANTDGTVPQCACGPLNGLTPAQIETAAARSDLLRHYCQSLQRAEWSKKSAARDQFMVAYNSGIAFPSLYNRLGKLTYQAIERWKRIIQGGGTIEELADRRGIHRRGATLITDEQSKILLQCALHPNKPLISEVVRMAKAIMHQKGIANGHSESTYRRWLHEWRDANHHIWTFSREGAKAWNDQCAYYIERDYSVINVGDILVADGHVLNFEIINPWTGKPKRMALILFYDMKSNMPLGWEIMPTENTAAIASALRRAILRLGKMPRVVYLDNGRAFRARFFSGCADFCQAGIEGLFSTLNISTIFAWPYHGQSKTIERFFGTFAELERWCPTYTGTSIENKPPRMMRGERLHRRVHEKATGGQGLTLEQAHRAIALWFDTYAARPQRGHMDGATPMELFEPAKGPGVDSLALRYLMMAQEIRTIHRNGISFLGSNYYHAELYGRRHPVVIRYDLQDASAVYVFDQKSGDFICAAPRVEGVHPAAHILGDEQDRETLSRHIAEKRRQEKAASQSARAFLEEEVLPAHRRQLLLAGVGTADAPASKPAAPRTAAVNPKQIEAQVAAYYDEQARPAVDFWGELEQMPELDRYERLVEAETRGQLIPERWQAFMAYIEQTQQWQALQSQGYWDQVKAQAAVMYQVSSNG